MTRTILCLLLLIAAVAPTDAADTLKGDEAKDAKEKLKGVKKDWKTATKAEKLVLLRTLNRLPEKSVGSFLLDVISDDEDDLVAERASWTLTRHGDPEDAEELDKEFKKAKTPGRRAACARWMGAYGDKSPLKDLKKYALDADDSAEASTLALADMDTPEGWNAVDVVAQTGKHPGARRVAIWRLLAKDDKRGVEALGLCTDLEEGSWAAHAAIAGDLETPALKKVLELAGKPLKLPAGKRPNFFGSLLGRLTRQESHEAVVAASGTLNRQFDVELGWWLISHNRAACDVSLASRWLNDEDKDDILNGLRYLQRRPEPLAGNDLKVTGDKLKAMLAHADDDIAAHALLTCVATGTCRDDVEAKVEAWIKDEKAFRRAAALLAAGQAGYSVHANRAIELLTDESWFVQSAALDCLLHLRPGFCAADVLAYARRHGEGRMFSEAIALLVDMTGQDFGDQVDKWDEWLKANDKFEVQKRKLDSLRGVIHQKLRGKTAATFYGLEINSINVQFAMDRSVSMVNPVTREPERQDYTDRKADILKRRPEVNRMVREGFLPRFYVAAAEMSAALDGMSQGATFGITLFNHEQIERPRVKNDLTSRKDAVNWMLSTEVQGGTDIKAALLAIIEKGEADTILLLSDGEPLSLSILEVISRANAIRRVNIFVVSIHKDLFNRHYLDVLATRDHGKIVDAEPKD
jgi:hypothetical protein